MAFTEIEVEFAEAGGAFAVEGADFVFLQLEEASVEAEPEGLELALVAAEGAVGGHGLGAFVVLEGVGGEAGEEAADAGEQGGGAVEFGDDGKFGLGEI